MSLFTDHCNKWAGGCGAEICDRARTKCFCRGDLPCDILFVGEAPGESENVLAKPFVGPAGKLLDDMIRRASLPSLRIAFTNLVLCIPRGDDGKKAGEPSLEDIRACAPRLVEFVGIAKPKLIVCVGSLARDHLDSRMLGNVWKSRPRAAGEKRKPESPFREIPRVHITHPAAILRGKTAQQSLQIRTCIVTIQNSVEEVFRAQSPGRPAPA
jgi:uracil-DNA glycosylase family 4